MEGPPAKKQKTGKKQKNVEVEAQPEEGVQVWEGINRDLLPPDDYAYGNVGVLRGNAMKFLPNFFEKGQVSPALPPRFAPSLLLPRVIFIRLLELHRDAPKSDISIS